MALHLPCWMQIQSVFHYQQWIGTWRSKIEQKTNGVLLAYWSKRRNSQRSWTYWLLGTTSSSISAQCLKEASRRGILGRYWFCGQRRIKHSIKHDRMQLSFKEHFQLIVFKKLWAWKLEKFCLKNHTYVLDHHQRSHWDTITIGPEGMMNWVLQLNNSQSANSFNSLLEKFNMQNSSNQPNLSSPIRDRSVWPLITHDVVSVQACSSADSKSLNVEQTHDRSGRLAQDTVAAQDEPGAYHEGETFNIDDETLRERIEAEMDLKIPGLPHSIVKHAKSTSIQ